MFAFKSAVVLALRADSVVPTLLTLAPNMATPVPAIYVQHIAYVEKVAYPSISLFLHGEGADAKVLSARDGRLQVDCWVPDVDKGDGTAYGNAGAWQVYEAVRRVLHMAHQRGTLSADVLWCAEQPGSVSEDFETPQRLHHISGVYRYELQVPGDEFLYPNA